MGPLSLILFLSLAHSILPSFAAGGTNQFNVMDFGAAGNGVIDDSQAFQKAWTSTCNARGAAIMTVPSGKIFLVGPTSFTGPCKSTNVKLQVLGSIVAPVAPSAWKRQEVANWLIFKSVEGFTVSGNGIIDGRGSQWWERSCVTKPKPGCISERPTMVAFFSCNGLQLRDLTLKDGQQMHLYIQGSKVANVTGLKIVAPESSPNTDGIHLQDSKNVFISNSTIGTGDDCISIGTGNSDIYIQHIHCGPGHGISVGSLGSQGSEAAVESIHVRYVDFHGTTNGARIKTWQGGKGYARTISFKNLNFTNVFNPVIIDQYYCPHRSCPIKADAVKISDITFSNLQGTSSSPEAITLNCSTTLGCTGIHLNYVNIVAAVPTMKTKAKSVNAQCDKKGIVSPPVQC